MRRPHARGAQLGTWALVARWRAARKPERQPVDPAPIDDPAVASRSLPSPAVGTFVSRSMAVRESERRRSTPRRSTTPRSPRARCPGRRWARSCRDRWLPESLSDNRSTPRRSSADGKTAVACARLAQPGRWARSCRDRWLPENPERRPLDLRRSTTRRSRARALPSSQCAQRSSRWKASACRRRSRELGVALARVREVHVVVRVGEAPIDRERERQTLDPAPIVGTSRSGAVAETGVLLCPRVDVGAFGDPQGGGNCTHVAPTTQSVVTAHLPPGRPLRTRRRHRFAARGPSSAARAHATAASHPPSISAGSSGCRAGSLAAPDRATDVPTPGHA